MDHLIYGVFLYVTASLFAYVEINIEGEAGWAEDLPTWRIRNDWTRVILGARALTGYHLYIHLFVLTIILLPFALDLAPVTVDAGLRVLSYLILFWLLEDFLWFVYNPAYGLKRFKAEHIPWHAKSWWWIMPRGYWIFLPIGIALYVWSW